MDIRIILVGIIVLVFGADLYYQSKVKQKKADLLKQLNTLLAKEDYKGFDELIETDEVKRSFPRYNLAFMRLNEAMLKNNPAEINKAFTGFNIRMNKVQKETVLKRAFYYYLGVEDKKRTEHYYKLLKELGVKDEVTLDIMYDVYVEKGYKYLNEVLDNYEKLPKDEQIPYVALIGDMYRNMGNTEKAEEYGEMANTIINSLKKEDSE